MFVPNTPGPAEGGAGSPGGEGETEATAGGAGATLRGGSSAGEATAAAAAAGDGALGTLGGGDGTARVAAARAANFTPPRFKITTPGMPWSTASSFPGGRAAEEGSFISLSTANESSPPAIRSVARTTSEKELIGASRAVAAAPTRAAEATEAGCHI